MCLEQCFYTTTNKQRNVSFYSGNPIKFGLFNRVELVNNIYRRVSFTRQAFYI